METLLFPFAEYWWFYACFAALVLVMLAIDLGIFHRESHLVTFREAATWSVVWVVLSLAFNVGLYAYAREAFADDPRLLAIPGFDAEKAARQIALEFFTGYTVEKALAVDNIFVFVVVFSYFGIPAKYQHKVLFYGIIGALIFRATFIALGAVALQHEWVVWLFGAFLILTGIKTILQEEETPDPGKTRVIRWLKRVLPLSGELKDDRFFTREGGKLLVTPLLLTLLVVEVSDIIFAFDSVSAIFAITNEPFLVFTSNIFAILGLRAMYFLLASVIHKFHYLRYGLGLILIFVGLKMVWLNELMGGKFPISWSLAIIGMLLFVSIGASFVFKSPHEDEPS